MLKQRILIADGDLIAYKSAAAVEKRTIIVKHLASGRTKEFSTRTELKELLKSKDKEYIKEDYDITDIQTPECVSHVLYIIKNLVNKLQETAESDRTEIFIGSGETFRHRLALPSPYKDNRKGLRPVHLQAARDYLMQNYTCSYIKDIETDDAITIRSYEEKAKGNTPILASLDKDAQGTQGIVVLNWMKDYNLEPLEEIPLVGSLWKDKTTVKGNGLMFIAYQTLAGDPSDTYSGYELSEVKYGPMRALKALECALTEQEVLSTLIREFKLLYPAPFDYTDCHGVEHTEANWLDMLNLFWACAYMKRSWGDTSSFVQFAAERGVYVQY